MTTTKTKHEWESFFKDAKLPANVIEKYANTFTYHKVAIEMLKALDVDLLKEYFTLMKIDPIHSAQIADHVNYGKDRSNAKQCHSEMTLPSLSRDAKLVLDAFKDGHKQFHSHFETLFTTLNMVAHKFIGHF